MLISASLLNSNDAQREPPGVDGSSLRQKLTGIGGGTVNIGCELLASFREVVGVEKREKCSVISGGSTCIASSFSEWLSVTW